MATAKKAPAESGISIVRESFMVEVEGVPVVYRKGEPVDPSDPVLKRMDAHYFEPLVFPHPPRRARMRAPEVRT